ncbi:Fur-regulated basic protein FbpA [Heyndrickxia sporothermodurans]
MDTEKENLKKYYIDMLLANGVYKKSNRQLYEISLYELEEMYNEIIVGKTS